MAMTLGRRNISGMLRRIICASAAHLSPNTEKSAFVSALTRFQSSTSIVYPASYVPPTSLSRPPWPELPPYSPEEEARRHQALVQKVNALIEEGQYGRLFAVVHFAARQWKVTNEDLILIENHLDAECGDRIRMEKVLLVGGSDFTLVGKPLLGRDLVQVQATVIEKTQSWPMVHMRFWKRHRFQKKRIIVQPQTVLRINTIHISPRLC
ncbi:large ribosomal subunit protein bL21m [Danio rerio]|uniref:Large ribosomal subunit protein bL21m n=1 Tax=Danio rerio TaxID=7955 RepID=Q05AN2_DANRE|nr:39S ribosomal protein L21, mitochondrial [Danio rerio]AAI24337.1 Zgc:153377 [Danio rerio]|eukprot:NP_001070936.1 39S ribosomal protein L21, mitochondrial [Danio rerio]